MKKLSSLLLVGFLAIATVACDNNAKTSADAPNSMADSTQTPSQESAQNSQGDATSDVRKAQIESDIRSREQRNNTTGGDTDRADGDLESEVRGKLEANLPASQLTVDAKNGTVTVAGTVPTQQQFDKIEPLAKQIKGVSSVNVQASVAKAQ